jgi:hypothetical protein
MLDAPKKDDGSFQKPHWSLGEKFS